MHIDEVSDPFKSYISPKGRVFRLVCVQQMQGTEKWYKGDKKSLYRVLVIYENNEMDWLEFNYDNILIKVCKFER